MTTSPLAWITSAIPAVRFSFDIRRLHVYACLCWWPTRRAKSFRWCLPCGPFRRWGVQFSSGGYWHSYVGVEIRNIR